MFPRKSYFFNMGFEAISYIYFMFRKKSYVFSIRDKKLFDLNTST